MTLSSPMPVLSEADTHTVFNIVPELVNYNLFTTDTALNEALNAHAPTLPRDTLTAFGALTGSDTTIKHGFLANENPPKFHPHDRGGKRIDLAEYHPSYHALMDTSITHGLHASPWTDRAPHAHLARACHTYLMSQIEAGHGCPVTMTFACVPTLRKQPEIAAQWLPSITARHYDPSNTPWQDKSGLTIGMAMSEKQGGSDVRANTTQAIALGARGPGRIYQLVGHKYFMSAPMCDGFLVLAYAPGGLSCFLMPRWREDGTKNSFFLQRLKHKMGNVSNGSSEVEFRGAHAWLIGEEGRGVANILEMVSLTRFDCMVGSSAGMRQAVAQASFHCLHREAFGKRLIDQPLMQNVLCDLAIESDAAMHLSLRVAKALDTQHDPHEAAFLRIATPIGKYWICKRTPGHAYEAMECIGGSGVMEMSMMPRLYREAPINAIWEGSGNVQCLDMFRAMQKSPESVQAFFVELETTRASDRGLDALTDSLEQTLTQTAVSEWEARRVIEKMALALQASLLIRHAHPAVAEAFIASRVASSNGGYAYGTLPTGSDAATILARALPT